MKGEFGWMRWFGGGLELEAGAGRMLRLPEVSAAAAVFAEIERSRAHLRAWMPWLDRTRTARDTRRFLEANAAAYRKGGGFSFAVLEGDRFAGMVGFHGFDAANRVTSLGYWLGQAFCGRGLMTAAARAAVRYAFEQRRMNRVVVRCATGNTSSRRVPERLGFVHEGTHREAEWLYDHFVDLEVYAMLRREWAGDRAQGVDGGTAGMHSGCK